MQLVFPCRDPVYALNAPYSFISSQRPRLRAAEADEHILLQCRAWSPRRHLRSRCRSEWTPEGEAERSRPRCFAFQTASWRERTARCSSLNRRLHIEALRFDPWSVTPHTLRHTFASIADEFGFSELTICALLGHAPHGITPRYIHIDDAPRFAANGVTKAIGPSMPSTAGQIVQA